MRSLLKENDGSAGMIGGVVALLVSIIIGVLVWFQINGSIITSALGSHGETGHSTMGTLFNSTNTTANTILTLMPITAVVIVAGIILAVVAGFGRGGNV